MGAAEHVSSVQTKEFVFDMVSRIQDIYISVISLRTSRNRKSGLDSVA